MVLQFSDFQISSARFFYPYDSPKLKILLKIQVRNKMMTINTTSLTKNEDIHCHIHYKYCWKFAPVK